jgi:hypothetical protein
MGRSHPRQYETEGGLLFPGKRGGVSYFDHATVRLKTLLKHPLTSEPKRFPHTLGQISGTAQFIELLFLTSPPYTCIWSTLAFPICLQLSPFYVLLPYWLSTVLRPNYRPTWCMTCLIRTTCFRTRTSIAPEMSSGYDARGCSLNPKERYKAMQGSTSNVYIPSSHYH